MYSTPIPGLPGVYSRNKSVLRNDLKDLITRFYLSNDEFHEVIFDSVEYSSSASLYSGLKKAVKVLDVPIDVVMIHGGIYLRRQY